MIASNQAGRPFESAEGGTIDSILVRLADLRKAAMLTALVGFAHAALFLIAILMFSQAPGTRASDAEVIDFYSSNDRRWVLMAGLYLLPFAGIAYIWFIVALRAWARGYIRRENALLSNVQLVAGIIYTGLLFVASASSSVSATVAEFDDQIDPALARQFPQFGNALLLVFAMRMAAMFVLTTTNIMRTTGLFPKWFTIAGYLVAAFLLFSASLEAWLVVVLPLWIVAFCAIVVVRARRIPRNGSLVEIEAAGIVLIRDSE
jgi:hypothetical protein